MSNSQGFSFCGTKSYGRSAAHQEYTSTCCCEQSSWKFSNVCFQSHSISWVGRDHWVQLEGRWLQCRQETVHILMVRKCQKNPCCTQLMWKMGLWFSTWVQVFNEDSYKQENGLMYLPRGLLLHKSKFVERREGNVSSSSCFTFDLQLWGHVYIPVLKASMNNGKSGRLWHDSEEGKGRTQPTPSRFAALRAGTRSGKRYHLQILKLKLRKREKEGYLHRAEDGWQGFQGRT